MEDAFKAINPSINLIAAVDMGFNWCGSRGSFDVLVSCQIRSSSALLLKHESWQFKTRFSVVIVSYLNHILNRELAFFYHDYINKVLALYLIQYPHQPHCQEIINVNFAAMYTC